MVKLKRTNAIEGYFKSGDLTMEAKKDVDDLKAHLGDDLFDDYMKIRDRIADPEWKNFEILKNKDIEEIKDYVDNFQSESDKRKKAKEGAKKIYSDEEWNVFRITTYPAAQYYGKGTRWCITGRYAGHEEKGEFYFNDYIQKANLDGGYYFFINKKDPNIKYSVLLQKNGEINSIWTANDSELKDVDPDDAPIDLLYLRDSSLPFGEALADYIEENAGQDFNISDALVQEINSNNPDPNRISDYVHRLKAEGEEDFDYYFDIAKDDKAFKAILRVVAPTKDFIKQAHDQMTYILEDFVEQYDWWKQSLDSDYFNAMFEELVEHSGYYKDTLFYIYNQQKFWNDLIKLCDKDLSYDVKFEQIKEALDEKIADKDFLESLLDKDYTVEDIIRSLYYEDEYNEKLIKNLVALNKLDFNDEAEWSGYGDTIFCEILSNLKPKVDFVKWMIAHGADPYIKDDDGYDAIEYTEDPQIEKLLEKE